MYQEKLSFSKALKLEEDGHITIVDASPDSLEPILHTNGKSWKDNFIILQSRATKVNIEKVVSFFGCKFIIEVLDPGHFSWRYLHGLENSIIVEKVQDEIEYVYVLMNKGYPGIVKIGMTTTTVEKRVAGINATSTLVEWEPIFALPVKKGSALKIEQQVHSYFQVLRQSTNLGNQREFFTLSPFQAIDKIREVGAMYQVGEPILY